MTLHFLNHVVILVKSKGRSFVRLMASLKSEPTCKVIHIIQGSCLLISNLPGSL